MFNRLKMPKKLNKGTVVLFVLGAAITGFTSLRTIDILKFTMPPDQQAFAWFGWACFEVGLAAWIYWHGAGARRDQRTIAEVMIVVDLLAVIVAFVADVVLVQARKGGIQVDSGSLTWAIIIAVCLIATANLAAIIGTKIYDPDARKRIKQEEYQEALEEAQEEAEHQIELERLKYIAKNATAIAPHIGYQQGMDWTQQMYQRWALPGQSQPQLPPPHTNVQPVTGQLSQVAQVKRTCDACGKGGPGGLDGSVWLCQECLDRTLTSRAAHIAAIRESAQSETKPDTAMDEWFNLYKKSGESGIMSFPAFMKKMRDATNPLPKSPLDSQASHEGNQNGNK